MAEDRLKDVKELLTLAMALIQATGKSLADGRWDFMDVTNFVPVISTIGPAVDGLGNIPATFSALTNQDQAELIQWFEEKFKLTNWNSEDTIETLFRAAVPFAKLVYKFKK